LFAIHGIVALPITVFILYFQYKYRVKLSGSTVQTSEQLVKSKSLESEGPGFISIPDIISKIHITMHKKA
jgi:hypothetical protein